MCLFCCSRICVDRSWEYINHSQTHECGNWDWGRAISRKGKHKWNVRCSVFEVFVCIIETHFRHELWYNICWSSFLSLIGKKAHLWIKKSFFPKIWTELWTGKILSDIQSLSLFRILKKSFFFTLKTFPIDGYIFMFTFVHFAKFLAVQNIIKNTIV